ncbi:MAG: hypothetical protein JSS74_11475 [Actinobacteria bacterium]|nr:hypothetical protein [Actinomycetota bacterium]
MKRNAFGQLIPSGLHLRFFAPIDGEGTGGDGGGAEYTPPATQEDLNKIVNERIARERKKFDGYEDFKAKAAKWEAHEAAEAAKGAEPKPTDKADEKPTGLSEAEVQKRIDDARAADRLELALDRVNDALDKALEGRTFAASLLITLDRKQFVAEDGKSVDATALADWVKGHTTEAEKPEPEKRRRLPGQGERGSSATGGSVSAGRDLYDDNHKKPSGKD